MSGRSLIASRPVQRDMKKESFGLAGVRAIARGHPVRPLSLEAAMTVSLADGNQRSFW